MPHPRKNRRRQRGFSILETLVAIAILLIATTGPMVFAQQSLRAARLSRDQVTAFYLAQDAIEFVKHIRDENSLVGSRADWLAGLEECYSVETDPQDGCQVSVPEWSAGDTAEAVTACGITGDCLLRECGDMFGIYDTGCTEDLVDSRFSRRVKIMTPEGTDPVAETEEALVEVVVSWEAPGLSGDRQVLVREHIYNWIQ
jgi:prepilin-type N-terminal cleavage/methylation domain-containing protein